MPKAPRVSRRSVLATLAAAAGSSAWKRLAAQPAAPSASSAAAPTGHDVVVIGAGVFGAWTAWHLRQLGKRVLLVDAWGPAHARASSGGESRMTRTVYGGDEIYTQFAWQSLEDWRWLSTRSDLPLFHPTGVLFFFAREEPYVTQSIELHARLGIPVQTLDRAALATRFPQMAWDGIALGLYEPDRGALMARRAVQSLVRQLVAAGGEYRQLAIAAPQPGDAPSAVLTTSGERLHAEHFVFACGPWLPKIFPQLLGGRVFPTRQEVFFFAPEAGDARFAPPHLPGWADFNEGDIYYGFPDLEARGFKIAHDRHGPAIDPDTGDRTFSPGALADVRSFMTRRFPALARRPLVEARVCQYENSSNGDLLVDRHPQWHNVWLVGAGSGHGFKHGPAVGRYTAQLVSGQLRSAEPRFSLATKAARQQRGVH